MYLWKIVLLRPPCNDGPFCTVAILAQGTLMPIARPLGTFFKCKKVLFRAVRAASLPSSLGGFTGDMGVLTCALLSACAIKPRLPAARDP